MVMAPSLLETNELYIPEHYIGSEINSHHHKHGENGLVNARESSRGIIVDILKEKAASINIATCHPGEEDPFYVADMGEIYRQHLRWKMNLGRVKPFYGTSQYSAHIGR
jgi:ornithine decarboxylase